MKNFRKSIIVLAVMLLSATGFSQGVFDKFEDQEDVTSIILNPKMFRMLATMGINLDDPEAQAYVDMAKKITGFKVFTTGNERISADMEATVEKYLKSSSLEELMRIKDGAQTVQFYVKEGKDENHVKELLMYITGLKELTKDENIEINGQKREFETVVMSLTGDIDLRQISKLTNQMDIPGGDQLKKAGDKKKGK
ncbi:DUF4252 domain-containing protein [Winogradskyella ursingii]|uniref:DUF4252 domain-containing protein n=1 Tax=Winogradskyella ursingii TaxID=2686079 RepID=UPI0015CE11A0|nr:DUF4252 domain-containing protein [Winogradskyella ursingii]